MHLMLILRARNLGVSGKIKMNKILKFLIYFVCSIPLIVIAFLLCLTIYDSVQVNQLKSKINQVQIGDTKEEVMKKLGKPNYTWSKGGSGFFANHNSGVAYGGIMDWKNAFHSEPPYFYPFRFRLFTSDKDDIDIILDNEGLVSNIKIPK